MAKGKGLVALALLLVTFNDEVCQHTNYDNKNHNNHNHSHNQHHHQTGTTANSNNSNIITKNYIRKNLPWTKNDLSSSCGPGHPLHQK